MYICVCVYAFECTCAYELCVYVCMYVCMCICIYACVAYACMHVCTCVCTYVHVCVCMYVCMNSIVKVHRDDDDDDHVNANLTESEHDLKEPLAEKEAV